MSTTSPRPTGPETIESPENLTDRIAARVVRARLALEEGATAGPSSSSPADPTVVGERHEAESLRRVFHELGVSYRRYRKQVGGPVTPGLRDAAYQFRAEPSLASLVAVAAYLDKLDLLS
ncbi:MAG TPA: hypothetical protein VFZ87_04225 [Gemmatimonadales bacterium]